MFHVMLVFPVLVIMAMAVSALLFGIFALIAGALGGASAALFVKNKAVKRLLFVGLSILTFVGLICALPVVAVYAQFSEPALTFSAVAAVLCIGILSGIGMKFSAAIKNRAVKTILMVIFGLLLAAALSVAIFIPVVRHMLISA